MKKNEKKRIKVIKILRQWYENLLLWRYEMALQSGWITTFLTSEKLTKKG